MKLRNSDSVRDERYRKIGRNASQIVWEIFFIPPVETDEEVC